MDDVYGKNSVVNFSQIRLYYKDIEKSHTTF